METQKPKLFPRKNLTPDTFKSKVPEGLVFSDNKSSSLVSLLSCVILSRFSSFLLLVYRNDQKPHEKMSQRSTANTKTRDHPQMMSSYLGHPFHEQHHLNFLFISLNQPFVLNQKTLLSREIGSQG